MKIIHRSVKIQSQKFLIEIWHGGMTSAFHSFVKKMSANTKSQGIFRADLRVGFVPLVDCAPLVVAQEFGIFKRHGIRVKLQREFGWASIREKLIFGELDAAHAAGGLSLAMTLGIGCHPTPALTGLVLSRHGNTIVISQRLWKEGARPGSVAEVIRKRIERPTLGVVSLTSSHYFLLLKWLRAEGLDPRKDVRIAVLPPPQMAENLRLGNIDGFCAGEPWGSVAIDQGSGVSVAISPELCREHPEKVLLVRESFEMERAEEHARLRAALLEACLWCDQEEHRSEIAEVLSKTAYVRIPSRLLRRSLCGPFEDGMGNFRIIPDFMVFSRDGANAPDLHRMHWLLEQMEEHELIHGHLVNRYELLSRVFRMDLYEQTCERLKSLNRQVSAPEKESKPERKSLKELSLNFLPI